MVAVKKKPKALPQEEELDEDEKGKEKKKNPEDDVEMGFFEHLAELRRRLRNAILGLLPAMCVGWYFKERLLEFLLSPYVHAWRRLGLGEPQLHFANPVDPFVSYLKISFVVGLIISAPWIFWQVWGFIAPGLYRRERRLAYPFVFVSTIFFVGGMLFGYYVVFPMGFETFLGFAGLLPSESARLQPTIMMTEYLDLTTRMLVAFGAVFEVPVVTTFLAAAGIVTWRQLLKFSRWWLIIAAIVSAIITPPDAGSMLVMFVPMVVLYFASIGVAALFGRAKAKRDAAARKEAEEEGYER